MSSAPPGLTRHCHQCGTPYLLSGTPGRSETCERCRADLHVCLNCTHYDARMAQQCRERRAEPEANKGAANFCEWFEFAKRVWEPAAADMREAKARDSLKRLLGE